MAKKNKLKDVHDSNWAEHSNEWATNRAVYIGGDLFIDNFLVQHKAENLDDFDRRKKLTFDPSVAQSAVDKVLDTITSGLWDVERSGNDSYTSWADTSVCGYNCPMSTFIANAVLPEFAIAGECYVLVDKDAEGDTPFCYVIPRENIKVSTFDSAGIKQILYVVYEDVYEADYGLPVGKTESYMLWSRGENLTSKWEKFDPSGKKEKEGVFPYNIPIIHASIKRPLLTAISKIQIAHMNLGSQDINFLTRANFPLYVEQYDPKSELWANSFSNIPHIGSEDSANRQQAGLSVSPDGSLPSSIPPNNQRRLMGVGTGVRYPKDLEAPAFINPSPECVTVSMQKQLTLVEDIVRALNSTISAITRVMQSAATKTVDQTGELRFSEYMSWVLESLELGIGKVFYQYMGISGEPTVTYPEYRDETVDVEGESPEEVKEVSND